MTIMHFRLDWSYPLIIWDDFDCQGNIPCTVVLRTAFAPRGNTAELSTRAFFRRKALFVAKIIIINYIFILFCSNIYSRICISFRAKNLHMVVIARWIIVYMVITSTYSLRHVTNLCGTASWGVGVVTGRGPQHGNRCNMCWKTSLWIDSTADLGFWTLR